MKQFITLDGKSLSGIDIGNSQPLFFGLILIDQFKKRRLSQTEDLKKYIELCLNKQFYEYLIAEYEKEGKIVKDRNTFKITFFQKIFFCKNPKNEIGIVRVFKSLFPTVYEAIKEFKRVDYKALSILLQKKESEMILDNVITSAFKKIKGLKCFNIHDCVYFTDDVIDDMFVIFRDSFKKQYNVDPKLKLERYNSESELITDSTPVLAPLSLPVIEPIQTPAPIELAEPKQSVSETKTKDRPLLTKGLNSFDLATFMEEVKGYEMPSTLSRFR